MIKLTDIYKSVVQEATFERDAEMVNLARKKGRQFKQYLKRIAKKGYDRPFKEASAYDGYLTTLGAATGDSEDWELYILLAHKDKFPENFNGAFGKLKGKGINALITFPLLSNPNSFSESDVDDFNLSTFVHEYIHYLDYLRYDDSDYKGYDIPKHSVNTRDNISKYLNSPEEFNAIYLEIMEGIFSAIEKMQQMDEDRPLYWLFPTYESLLKYMKKKYFDEYDQFIKSKYKRKFMKRTYNFWEEIKDKTAKDIDIEKVLDDID